MRLTYELLVKHNACKPQRDEFRRLFPAGCEPTVENLFALANQEYAAGRTLDVLWLVWLLPAEGPGSVRAFSLWCAEQVAYLCDDQRVRDCIAVVRRRVDSPGDCTDGELAVARDAARDAAWAAAGAVARAAARDAAVAWAVARDAAWAAQIACLSQLLCEAE